jgi:hypothetical protein
VTQRDIQEGEPSLAGPTLQAVVRSLERRVAVGRTESLESLLDESLAQPRFRTVLVVLFTPVPWHSRGAVCTARSRGPSRNEHANSASGRRSHLGGAFVGGKLVRDLLHETQPFEPAVADFVAVMLATLRTGGDDDSGTAGWPDRSSLEVACRMKRGNSC